MKYKNFHSCWYCPKEKTTEIPYLMHHVIDLKEKKIIKTIEIKKDTTYCISIPKCINVRKLLQIRLILFAIS